MAVLVITTAASGEEALVIAPGDVVFVAVYGEGVTGIRAVVDDEGKVSILQYEGLAAGRTEAELALLLKDALAPAAKIVSVVIGCQGTCDPISAREKAALYPSWAVHSIPSSVLIDDSPPEYPWGPDGFTLADQAVDERTELVRVDFHFPQHGPKLPHPGLSKLNGLPLHFGLPDCSINDPSLRELVVPKESAESHFEIPVKAAAVGLGE